MLSKATKNYLINRMKECATDLTRMKKRVGQILHDKKNAFLKNIDIP